MRNPGLSAFGGPTMYKHPLVDNIRRGDPDFDEEEEETDPSDFKPGVDFGRWRSPGSSIRVPAEQGPVFAPGQTPENVIQGEVISPREQDAADGIINGDHDLSAPSENPDVEQARQSLHTPGASDTVSTLSGLLSGRRPEDVGGMDEAHDWLSQHFTGVRVNPNHGTLLAQSPAGTQIIRRRQHMPAVPQQPTPSTYTLSNKHGDFDSDDPQRIIRSMIAFQIVHNAIAAEQQKKKDDDNNGLGTTSGIRDWITERLNDRWEARGNPVQRKSKPRTDVPAEAVWEPHAVGKDVDRHGRNGGWVVPAHLAPAGWKTIPGTNTAVSPGHGMNSVINPTQNQTPWPDPVFAGHTFTYAKSDATGHTAPVDYKGAEIWVKPDVHPLARGPKPLSTLPPLPAPTPHRQAPGSGGSMITSSAQTNDLCPVCASGYLEPYDDQHHECLNCGSLVAHVGFERHAAARPKGGLGRGLGQIIDPGASAAGMGLNDDGSVNTDTAVNLDETQTHHPLFGAPALSEDQEGEVYDAPTELREKGQVRRQGSAEEGPEDPDTKMEKFLADQGFTPVHRPGQSRVYSHPMRGVDGGYFRLTEGVRTAAGQPSGWALSADRLIRPKTDTFKVMAPGGMQDRRMPDVGDHMVSSKSMLIGGSHPVDDDALNRAIRDVHENGRNAAVYRGLYDTAYEPPSAEPRGSTQRAKRMLSSWDQMAFPVINNPGLTRFVS